MIFKFRYKKVRRKISENLSKLKNGGSVTLNGESLKIIFSDKRFLKSRVFLSESVVTVFKSENEEKSHREILLDWLKKESKRIITKRVSYLAKENGFEFNKIAIRDQSSRWGSCSSDKNLNFSWRLAISPPKVMDYVIIHELAHLRQMNHSKVFWQIVEEIMPDYKESYNWLRENGHELKMY